MAATVLAASLFVFVLLEVSIPGGFRSVVLAPGDTSSPRARRVIDEFHLDSHVLVRYWHWLTDAVQGEFGRSTLSDERVVDVIAPRLSISLQIMVVGVVLTLLVGVPLGLTAAAIDGRRGAKLLNNVLGLSQSIPIYVTPIFLISFFAVRLQWLPAAGWVRISDSVTGNLRALVLPITALVLAEVGIVARIVRSDVLRTMQSEFIAAATGKGLSRSYILFRHALRPSSLGLLNIVSLNIGSLLTGALIIETIFGIGALGQVMFEAAINRDLPLLLGITTYAVVIYVVLSTMVEAITTLVDPRIRVRR